MGVGRKNCVHLIEVVISCGDWTKPFNRGGRLGEVHCIYITLYLFIGEFTYTLFYQTIQVMYDTSRERT